LRDPAVEGDLEEMARKELNCEMKTSCGILCYSETLYKSVVGIQLLKTENPSVCVRVNSKVCGSNGITIIVCISELNL
jgi:hypothetical protein